MRAFKYQVPGLMVILQFLQIVAKRNVTNAHVFPWTQKAQCKDEGEGGDVRRRCKEGVGKREAGVGYNGSTY